MFKLSSTPFGVHGDPCFVGSLLEGQGFSSCFQERMLISLGHLALP